MGVGARGGERQDGHVNGIAIFGCITVWHDEFNNKNNEKKNNENWTHHAVIYLYIPTILWYGYAVCHSVPKFTTLPIPALPVLGNLWVFPHLCQTLALPNIEHAHVTSHCYPCTFVHKNVYGHDAPPKVRQLWIFCPGSLLTYALPGVLFASCWNHKDHRWLDLQSSKTSSATGACFAKLLQIMAPHLLKHLPTFPSTITSNILGHSSCANGIAEWGHFNVWQALFKACDGNQSKWDLVVTLVMGWSHYGSLMHGLLSIFHSYWNSPAFSPWHYWSYISFSATWCPPVDNWLNSEPSNHPSKTLLASHGTYIWGICHMDKSHCGL